MQSWRGCWAVFGRRWHEGMGKARLPWPFHGQELSVCGIAGILSLTGPLPPGAQHRLRNAAASLHHRGPDDEGFYLQGEMGLAFRRLSILDLAGGHQPMGNEDGSIQVIFNGEIYNYRELTRDLISRGHQFRTRSDTEVLVHLYEEKGPDLVHELRGMFAFALWDLRKRSLLLARDRLGIKPLFYRKHAEELIFASEIKGILATLPASAREMNASSLGRYLVFGYLSGDRSFFRGIQKLPPGHVLVCRDGVVVLRRYWSLPPVDPAPPFSREGAVCTLRDLLEESVRLRLISDVPLGAFLSGGIDSSCVVSMMRRVSHDPVRTFSIGFGGESSSELPVSRRVASTLRTDHHELVANPDAVSLVDQVVASFDEPFGDSSAIPTFLVSRLARSEVTVALSGDGGDELFCGYTRYRNLRRLESLRPLPAFFRRGIRGALLRWGPQSFWALRAAAALRRSLKSFPRDYLDSLNLLLDPRVAPALAPEVLPSEDAVDWEISVDGGGADPVEGAQRLDLYHYLPEDILAKVDRMSMACSLEARVPLLDHRLVEFVTSLPPAWKQKGGRPKSLLLEAAGQELPHQVWNRPKQGFSMPLGNWFRGELGDYLRDVLLGTKARQRGIWNSAGLESMMEAHQRGIWDLSEQLWSFLILELWNRRYLDGAQSLPAVSPGGRGDAGWPLRDPVGEGTVR